MAGRVPPLNPHPATEVGYRAARRRLRSSFSRWAQQGASELGPDGFEELIHLKWAHLDGHLTRWRKADLDAVLLKLFPAKVIVEDADLPDVIPEATAFIRFLADTGLLDPASDDPHKLCAHLDRITRRFRRRMADPSRYSPGKRFWLAAAQAGIPIDDDEAVATYIEQFNARPPKEREAILGRSTSLLIPGQHTSPTSSSPKPTRRHPLTP